MSPITVTANVARSADDVFSYATDPAHFSEWQTGVVGGHLEEPIPGEGTRCVTVRHIGFADRPGTSEVVHSDPPRTWRVSGIDGPIRATIDVSVTPLTENRAQLSITVDFQGHGIGRLLGPLVVRHEARKEMPANLATLSSVSSPRHNRVTVSEDRPA